MLFCSNIYLRQKPPAERLFREDRCRTMSCLTNSMSVDRIILVAIILLTIIGKIGLTLRRIFGATCETHKVCHPHPDPIYYNYDTI